MAEHGVTFELFYDGAWHPAPVLTNPAVKCMRGSKTPGNDTEPASGALTLDNTLELYAPRSVKSGLYGKIGQNTLCRLSADADIRMSGEVASWKPQRPVKGSGWTPVQLAGVLRRMGRGTDPIQSAMRRSYDNDAVAPVAYWPLEGGEGTSVSYDVITNTPTQQVDQSNAIAGQVGAVRFGSVELGGASGKVANIAGSWSLGMLLPTGVAATGQVSWQYAVNFGDTVRPGGGFVIAAARLNPAVAAKHLTVQTYFFDEKTVQVDVIEATPDLAAVTTTTVATGVALGNIYDNQPHAFQLDLTASGGTNVAWRLWKDGVSLASGTYTPSFSGAMSAAPYRVAFATNAIAADGVVAVGHSAVYTTNLTANRYVPLNGHVGETAADRFTRLCGEFGITSYVYGDPADTEPMGPQGTGPFLDQLDEIARTDDAQIFETRDDVALTMRTGASKLNQAPALTLNYLGHIQPGLVPVFGDEGIRNDVTARNPKGATRRVQQLTGPHNVQLPEADPQGVGRYQTSLDVNPQLETALTDAAGWRINLGTYNGTWYAEVTADLDAAPGLISAVNAVDIGDVVAIANLPADEALDTVEGLVIGIEEDLPAKRRLVTFYLVPAAPYRVGKLATASGDTDPFVGNADPDTAVTAASVAAGAASFTVNASPLWVTTAGDADSFPQDVVVGGQRVSISGVTGASSPQTFTVRTAGFQVRYPIAAGATVLPYQPLILTM